MKTQIITLKLKEAFVFHEKPEGEWYRLIEIAEDSNLEDLHYCIQDAVSFDNDHLYEFFIARTTHSYEKVIFDDEDGGVYNVPIKALFPLPKNRKLFYLFDFGDKWYFQVSKTKHAEKEKEPGVKYPRIIKSVGDDPEQYPEYDEY